MSERADPADVDARRARIEAIVAAELEGYEVAWDEPPDDELSHPTARMRAGRTDVETAPSLAELRARDSTGGSGAPSTPSPPTADEPASEPLVRIVTVRPVGSVPDGADDEPSAVIVSERTGEVIATFA